MRSTRMARRAAARAARPGRIVVSLALALAAARPARAVSPLVVDDAGTVDCGSLQLNAVWQLVETDATRSYLVPVNPVYGVSLRGEAGLTFGYVRRDAEEPTAPPTAAGASDVLLSTKWQLWQPDGGFTLSGRLDVKLPTASRPRELGTGEADVGGVIIATQCWKDLCLDGNAGYVAADVSRSVFADDSWFVGQALRLTLTPRWTLMAEIYGVLPAGGLAAPARGQYKAGAQLSVGEQFLVCGLLGSSFGKGRHGTSATVGFSWIF